MLSVPQLSFKSSTPPTHSHTHTQCFHFDQGVAHESALGSVYYFIKPAVWLLISNKTMRLWDQIAD